jgi:hypothetical protein
LEFGLAVLSDNCPMLLVEGAAVAPTATPPPDQIEVNNTPVGDGSVNATDGGSVGGSVSGVVDVPVLEKTG